MDVAYRAVVFIPLISNIPCISSKKKSRHFFRLNG
jgi:hypothetical protein